MMSLPNLKILKTEHKMAVVVLLVEMFNCIAMIGWSKMKYRLPDLTSHMIVLDVTGRGPIIANLHVTRECT
jgi:hypothetical protein